MAADMQAMLKFVSVMDGVSTEGVEPMWSPLEAGRHLLVLVSLGVWAAEAWVCGARGRGGVGR